MKFHDKRNAKKFSRPVPVMFIEYKMRLQTGTLLRSKI